MTPPTIPSGYAYNPQAGTITKGDMMVSAGNGYAMACSSPTIGTVLGKSLENFNGDNGVIEIAVGRL